MQGKVAAMLKDDLCNLFKIPAKYISVVDKTKSKSKK